ncbi:MAG: WYL domain-containing protein [Bacteroidales bacterium]|jgi:predicted DNA-binding transcriptional regulator YafY
MDQPKLERLLRVMQLLINNKRYTVEDLASRLGTSVRTAYRYIDTFKNAGFLVNEIDGIYSLSKESKQFRSISELVYFTEEEAFILKKAIESIDDENPALGGLKKKLYSVYDFKRIADVVVHPGQLNIVNNLIEAIKYKEQVILKNYRSSNSSNVTDRLTEPFAFDTNMVQVFCFEPASNQNKLFKVARIEEVVRLDKDWCCESLHRKAKTDVFRISGFDEFEVELRLTMLAANLLMEEYPLSEQFITKKSDNEFIFKTNVCSYEGVGRFVLGLCNETEVLGSTEFKLFLRDKRDKSRF